MTDLRDLIKSNCVHSRLSDQPRVARWENLTIVFVHGYPMSLRGFYVLATRAVFGPVSRLPARHWKALHAETQLLCRGLGHQLEEGKEAHGIVAAIRTSMGWSEESCDKKARAVLATWIDDIEEQISLLDQQPR